MLSSVPTTKKLPLNLITRRIEPGTVWHHIFQNRFPDPLGFGLSPSRFSDPRRRNKRRFGVYYVGATFEVAFLETLVRDKRNNSPGSTIIPLAELDHYVHVPITIRQPLDAVDMRGGNPIAMGFPTDAIRARSHREGQRASLALYQHTNHPDGIAYPSRLNENENLAVFDRAIHKLSAGPRRTLSRCYELAPVLHRYSIVIV